MGTHEKPDARTAKVIARTHKQVEQRKNALPPFLMVRSGLLNGLLVTLIAFLWVAHSMGFSMHPSEQIWPDIAAGALVFGGAAYGIRTTQKKYKRLHQDIKTIKGEFTNYVNNKDSYVYLYNKVYSPKLARILIRYIAKHDPCVFAKLIANPNSIIDTCTKSHVIAGYLSLYPSEAYKIVDTFGPDDIDYKVYQRAAVNAQLKRDTFLGYVKG